MTITKTKEEVLYKKIEKSFEIKLDDETLILNKWWIQDDISGDYDVDYEWSDRSKEVINKLSDDQKEELDEFVNDLE